MIKRIAFVFWIICLCLNSQAQQGYIYTSLDKALEVHPDSVFRLDLSKEQLKTFPTEILRFKNLTELDLSRNKLTDLPENFFFPNIEVLNLTKNKFEVFPESICKNTSLKQLLIGKNELSEFPECIGDLAELNILDAWFNPITTLPESIAELKKLKSLDLRGMNYSTELQEEWKKLIPWAKIEFDLGCDCGY